LLGGIFAQTIAATDIGVCTNGAPHYRPSAFVPT